jgi:serine protease AprX
MSIGTADRGSGDPLVVAVEKAWDRGITMVIAAGNDGPTESTVTSPGISRKAITVGNYNITGKQKSSSGRGPTSECIVKPDISAPGENIISCAATAGPSVKRLGQLKFVSRDYIMMSGTSMAAPAVSGAVALLLEKDKTLNPDDVKYSLKRCARKTGEAGNVRGWGILDIEKLLTQEVVYVRDK